MNEKLVDMKDVFHFDEAGTLPPPGPIGRLVRLAAGLGLGYIVWDLLFIADSSDLQNPPVWFWAVFAAMLAPYVVNIGWGRSFGAWPRFILIGGVIAAAGSGYLMEGRFFSETLWWTLDLSMLYVYGHLGLAFVLSALIATPGCEMRALPHLYGMFSGKAAAEHYCPGFLRQVDHWELGIIDKTTPADDESSSSKDWLASGKAKLLVYGIPFVLIELVGNLGGRELVTWTWGFGFGLPGLFCIVNALRSGRVHCYSIGPVLLAAGVLTFLLGFDVLDFGPSSSTYLLNITIIAVIVLYLGSERIWGKYFGKKELINETNSS